MTTPSYVLPPATQDILLTVGRRIKQARLRRRLSAASVSAQVGISRTTLWSVEKGSPGVAIGIYAAVLHALDDMDRDLLLIGQNDRPGLQRPV